MRHLISFGRIKVSFGIPLVLSTNSSAYKTYFTSYLCDLKGVMSVKTNNVHSTQIMIIKNSIFICLFLIMFMAQKLTNRQKDLKQHIDTRFRFLTKST